MSLAREVSLVSRGGRPVLVQEALDPFGKQAAEMFALDQQPLAQGVTWLPAEAHGDVLRIDAEFEPGAASTIGLVLRAGTETAGTETAGTETAVSGSGSGERVVLAYDCTRGELTLNRTESGNTGFHAAFPSIERVAVPLENGRLRLRVFLDRCSIEVFAQDGIATITDLVFPMNSCNAVGLLAEGDGGTVVRLAVVG
jgi:levanase/fructan beta-fructosidase